VVENEIAALAVTAASIGFIHTLLGPDHYLPFAMMAKVRKWTLRRTVTITFVCGLGHIAASVALGIVGITLGIGLATLEILQSFRGNIAAWALIAFGLAYFVWGLRRAFKNRSHTHWHCHTENVAHRHPHTHLGAHAHVHQAEGSASLTPWALFIIFVLGPCESLIPLLMYPAARNSPGGVLMVTFVFGGMTLITMLGAVLISIAGLSFLPLHKVQRYGHALAGAGVGMCGVAVAYLGV
jgi:ABC-type nickel/cobalt efflux system permease component RcnA